MMHGSKSRSKSKTKTCIKHEQPNLVSKHKSQLHLHHARQKPVTEISILGRV